MNSSIIGTYYISLFTLIIGLKDDISLNVKDQKRII